MLAEAVSCAPAGDRRGGGRPGGENARQRAVTPPLQILRHVEELPGPRLQQRRHADGGQALSQRDALRLPPDQLVESLANLVSN